MTRGKDSGAQKQVEERRLRPIYEWLDNGNNKKALQECERVLKKQPDQQCAKALMSLALLRMGRTAEAEEMLDKVMAEKPTRDDVLHSMGVAFKEMNQAEKVCTMYENAVSVEPKNEELLTQLFMSYVRLDRYKQQQTCAMQLYRAAPKNPYYFWGVMSLLLQAQSCPDERIARTVILPLAERMVTKLEKEDKVEQEQEMHIYLMVLEMEHKFKEALDVLDGPLGRKLDKSCYLNFTSNKRLEYTKRLEMWSEMNVLSKKMLKASPDQWSVYLDYVTSVFHLVDARRSNSNDANHVNETDDGDGGEEQDSPDDTLAAARQFILRRKEEAAKSSSVRGPSLAEIELKCRFLARREKEEEDPWAEVRLLDLLCDYFARFGAKPVCASDLKLYLSSLEEPDQREFLRRGKETVDFDAKGVPTSLDQVNRHVALYLLERFMGIHHRMSMAEREDLVESLQGLFFSCQEMADSCTSNELRASDMYLVIAAHVLWQLWTESGSDVYFWRAVVPMEFALRLSKPNYHIRFMLIKFYNHAGAVGQADTVLQMLELKRIQLDSLGHLLTKHVFTHAHFKKASIMCANSLKFYTSNFKECVDYIVNCYRFGTFPKIQEFIGLRDRVASSQQYRWLSTERILVDLLVETSAHAQTTKAVSYLDIDPAKDDINWKELSDSRDFKAMISFEPPDRSVTDDLIAESFLLEQLFLRLRSLSVRAVVAAVQISSPPPAPSSGSSEDANAVVSMTSTAEDEAKRKEDLAAVIQNISEALGEGAELCEKEHEGYRTEQFMNPVQGPDRPRLVQYVTGGYHRLLPSLLRLVLRVYRLQYPSSCSSSSCPATSGDGKDGTVGRKAQEEAASQSAAEIADTFAGMTDRLKAAEAPRSLIKMDVVFEEMVNVAEASNFICIMCGVCHTLLKTKLGGGQKKGKKKKEARPQMKEFTTAFNAMLTSLEESLDKVQTLASSMTTQTEVDKITAADSVCRIFSRIKLNAEENHHDGEKTEEEEEEESGPASSSRQETLDALQEDVAKWIDSSHQYSLWELQNVIRNKTSYLKALAL